MNDFFLMLKVGFFVCLFFFIFSIIFFVRLSLKNDERQQFINEVLRNLPKGRYKIPFPSDKAECKILYSDSSKKQTSRNLTVKCFYVDNTVEPKVYLKAFCHLRQQVRSFRVDRIVNMSVNGVPVDFAKYYLVSLLKDVDIETQKDVSSEALAEEALE